jgi:hypothetical protein
VLRELGGARRDGRHRVAVTMSDARPIAASDTRFKA